MMGGRERIETDPRCGIVSSKHLQPHVPHSEYLNDHNRRRKEKQKRAHSSSPWRIGAPPAFTKGSDIVDDGSRAPLAIVLGPVRYSIDEISKTILKRDI
ncbi:hypothetical protein GWI33_006239 [Rhynchophorus ferrugineus]|uniref:Uncharacterized protein n=1 Tax=Rhynchophorus ferrugineus TaxID=354439 RepID=A0A834MDX7_RHYFE|nr:hypothetical protein GWI33_006239 [Rhynchophorus ferrugineus]